MSLNVDDALVVSTSKSSWEELHQQVAMKYELSSVENATLNHVLTINYNRQRGVLALGNANYVEQLAPWCRIPLDVKPPCVTPFTKLRTRLYPVPVTEEPLVGAHKQQAYRAGVGILN